MAPGNGMLTPAPGTKRCSEEQCSARAKRPRRSLAHARLSSHVTVAVRVRPLNRREQGTNSRAVVRVIDSQMLVFDPDDEVPFTPSRGHLQHRNKNVLFMFDRVFDESKNNVYVYENTTKGLLDKLIEGYNCSVFAYGATGSGKTYTMLGSQGCPGVIFHTVLELYERLSALKEDRSFKISVSYFEVYNETIRDLLQPGGAPLALMEDPVRGVIISKLSTHTPNDAPQLIQMLCQGNINRTQHPTDANAESSRSHAVFQVYLTQTEHVTGTSSGVRSSKISFIDLAGSERAAMVNSLGTRFIEGKNINRSLLALGNCINALADQKHKGHVPFRDSKLTRILKDSLGGTCQTVMIAAVSPSSLNYDDIHNTLKYADRAKNIRLEARRNMVNVDIHVSRYGAVLEEYKQKNDDLSARLRASQQTVEELQERVSELEKQLASVPPNAPPSTPQHAPPSTPQNVHHTTLVTPRNASQVPEHMFQDIERFYKIRSMLVKDLCECDGSLRSLELKGRLRERTLQNYSSLTSAPSGFQNCDKQEAPSKWTEARKEQLTERRRQLQQNLQQNFDCITELVRRAKAMCPNEEVDKEVRQLDLSLALKERQLRESILVQACLLQARQLLQWDQMQQVVLPHVRNLHLLAEGHKYITTDLQAAYQNILCLARTSSHVTWADQQDEMVAQFQMKDILDIPQWHVVPSNPADVVSAVQLETPITKTTCVPPRCLSPHPSKLGGIADDKDIPTPAQGRSVNTPAHATPRQQHMTPVGLNQTFDASHTPQFQERALRPLNRALEYTFVANKGDSSPGPSTLDATFMVIGTPKYMRPPRQVISHPGKEKKPQFVAPRGATYRNTNENVPHQAPFGRRPPWQQQRGGRHWQQRQCRPMRRSLSTSNVGMPQLQQPCPPLPYGPTWRGQQSYRTRGGYY